MLLFTETMKGEEVFQKLLVAEAARWVRMCNLQSAKNCASVKTSLATVHARAQEMGKGKGSGRPYIAALPRTDHVSRHLGIIMTRLIYSQFGKRLAPFPRSRLQHKISSRPHLDRL